MSSTKSKSRIVFCESEPEVIVISNRKLTIVECPEIVIPQRQSNVQNKKGDEKVRMLITKEKKMKF